MSEEVAIFQFSSFSGVGRVSGIACGYGLDGPGIESRWRRDFPHPSTPVLGTDQPAVRSQPAVFSGAKGGGRGLNHASRSRAEVKERVELYFNSPSVPKWRVLG
jgi:hypothetical protein